MVCADSFSAVVISLRGTQQSVLIPIFSREVFQTLLFDHTDGHITTGHLAYFGIMSRVRSYFCLKKKKNPFCLQM